MNMKKNYETPKVEKMEFNYSETVVASNGCGNQHTVTDTFEEGPNCSSRILPGTYYVSNEG